MAPITTQPKIVDFMAWKVCRSLCVSVSMTGSVYTCEYVCVCVWKCNLVCVQVHAFMGMCILVFVIM